jgi:hypothetical protein
VTVSLPKKISKNLKAETGSTKSVDLNLNTLRVGGAHNCADEHPESSENTSPAKGRYDGLKAAGPFG